MHRQTFITAVFGSTLILAMIGTVVAASTAQPWTAWTAIAFVVLAFTVVAACAVIAQAGLELRRHLSRLDGDPTRPRGDDYVRVFHG
jgi:hypothetical protein